MYSVGFRLNIMSVVLGFAEVKNDNRANQMEDDDLKDISTKRIKEFGSNNTTENSVSYKNAVRGESSMSKEMDSVGEEDLSEETAEDTEEFGGLSIEEVNVEDYECPNIILLKKEEKMIAKPWKKGASLKCLVEESVTKLQKIDSNNHG